MRTTVAAASEFLGPVFEIPISQGLRFKVIEYQGEKVAHLSNNYGSIIVIPNILELLQGVLKLIEYMASTQSVVVKFGSLPPGSTFRVPEKGTFLKSEDSFVSKGVSDYRVRNAVSLVNGEVVWFDSKDKVILVKRAEKKGVTSA